MVLGSHPLVWSLAMCPDDAKQDLYLSGLEGEHYFVFVVELTLLPPDARVSMAVQVTCR